MPIRIVPNGTVEYLRINEDGSRWRTTIHPGDLAEAQKHLSKNELNRVQAAWTPEVVQKWRDSLPVSNPRIGARPPSEKDRIAALEAKINELATRLDNIGNRPTR